MTKNNLQDVFTDAVFATNSLNAVDVTFVLNLLNDTFLTCVILLC